MHSNDVFTRDLNPCLEEKDIIIYGAADSGVRLYEELLKKAKTNVVAFVDMDVSKQGQLLYKVPVISFEALLEYDREIPIVVASYNHYIEITLLLNSHGFSNLFYINSQHNIEVRNVTNKDKYYHVHHALTEELISNNEQSIEDTRKILHDEKSLAVFNARINSVIYRRHEELERLLEYNQYFPDDIIVLQDKEVFVDCGAFHGETVLAFIKKAEQKYDYIFSFEANPDSARIAQMWFTHEKVKNISLFPLGVSDVVGKILFSIDTEVPSGSRISDGKGDIEVDVTTLDATLFHSEHRPTFIKMDVEGSELSALAGAKEIIARDHPKLAISVYHKDTDLWEIPLWIKNNFPGYKIYLRQHANTYETVCYAI